MSATVAAAALLTLDRGNSTLDARLGTGPTARHRFALGVDVVERFAAWLGDRRPCAAVAVSVVDGGLDAVAAVLAARGVPLAIAGTDLPCPLATRYGDPSRLGRDRWLGALAAARHHGDAIVVDCGTALTVNAVRGDGPLFLGGAIGLGLGSAARALTARAPARPGWDGLPPTAVPANDSVDAVRVGIGLGFAGGLLALVDRVAAAFDGADVTRILTGGDAPVARRLIEALDPGVAARFVDAPELIHDGLEILWSDRAPSC